MPLNRFSNVGLYSADNDREFETNWTEMRPHIYNECTFYYSVLKVFNSNIVHLRKDCNHSRGRMTYYQSSESHMHK